MIAYATTQGHNDSNQLVPMITATEHMAKAVGIKEEVGLVLADAGYWSDYVPTRIMSCRVAANGCSPSGNACDRLVSAT